VQIHGLFTMPCARIHRTGGRAQFGWCQAAGRLTGSVAGSADQTRKALSGADACSITSHVCAEG